VAIFATKEIPFGWRITLSLYCLCGLALAIGALFLPETPRKAHTLLMHDLCCVFNKYIL
jgi:hypothetical protein